MDQPMLSLAETHEGFRHEAFFYADEDEFLAGTSSFVRDGLDSDEPVLVVLNVEKLDLLRSELGGDADRVFFADMGEVGRNPGCIISTWLEFVERYGRHGTGLRGIGEPISTERAPAELAECHRHESLLNLAFADTPGFFLLCPYDSSALDDAVLEEARRTHPFVSEHGVESESRHYRGLDEVAAPFSEPLSPPPSRRDWSVFHRGTLSTLRAWVRKRASAAGLGSESSEDLVLAVHEVALNSVVHGGGGGICRAWTEGQTLVCELRDNGSINAPLAGRQRPAVDEYAGSGLWLANHLCDLVQIRSFETGGVVRLHKHQRG
jgi:anti-sigma regulatory factor (Ser/Thr protein kinase)